MQKKPCRNSYWSNAWNTWFIMYINSKPFHPFPNHYINSHHKQSINNWEKEINVMILMFIDFLISMASHPLILLLFSQILKTPISSHSTTPYQSWFSPARKGNITCTLIAAMVGLNLCHVVAFGSLVVWRWHISRPISFDFFATFPIFIFFE